MKRKKPRSHRQKMSLPAVLMASAAALTLAAAVAGSGAMLTRHALSEGPRASCGASSGITLPLWGVWQEVQVSQPGVLCAFRNKNTGFPTLNVIEEPTRNGAIVPGVTARESSIRDAYHMVGLTDATLRDSRLEPLGMSESFHTTVHYTSQGVPMEVLVMQVQRPDRTYTFSIVSRADGDQGAAKELVSILRGVSIEGVTDTEVPLLAPTGRPPSTATILVLIALLGTSLLLFGLRSARR